MNQLESKLREAFREKADRIPPDAPPLRLSGSVARGRVRRGPASRRKWLAAVAASAAVVVVAVAAVTVSEVVGSKTTVPARALGELSADHGLPPYYVSFAYRYGHWVAQLRVTRTKAVIDTIDAPRPYYDFDYFGLAGAPDDQVFVIAAQTAKYFSGSSQLFILHIDPGARSPSARMRLTALHLPYLRNMTVSSMALSPDGHSLAVIAWLTAPPGGTRLIVYNLETAASRSWNATDEIGEGPQSEAGTLSWTSNGLVGYEAIGGFGLLNPAAKGTSLKADSSFIRLRGAPLDASGQSVLNGTWRVALISPDGRWVFISVQLGGSGDEDLLKFAARTGRLAAIVNSLQVRITGPQDGREATWEQVLWINNSGSKLIVTYARPGQTAGIVSGRSYTPIPWPADTVYAAW